MDGSYSVRAREHSVRRTLILSLIIITIICHWEGCSNAFWRSLSSTSAGKPLVHFEKYLILNYRVKAPLAVA